MYVYMFLYMYMSANLVSFAWFIGAAACHEKYAGALTLRPQQRVSAGQTAVPDLAVVKIIGKGNVRERMLHR